jgi:hypothetical protein
MICKSIHKYLYNFDKKKITSIYLYNFDEKKTIISTLDLNFY